MVVIELYGNGIDY